MGQLGESRWDTVLGRKGDWRPGKHVQHGRTPSCVHAEQMGCVWGSGMEGEAVATWNLEDEEQRCPDLTRANHLEVLPAGCGVPPVSDSVGRS